MNKLSSLLSNKVGKKAKYDEIVDATYGTTKSEDPHNNEHEAMLGGISRASSSTSSREQRSLCTYLRQNCASVIIVVLLTIIFALAGERASNQDAGSELVENKLSTTEIKWRPCQLYIDPKDTSVKVLQTSIGDPSNQWGQVPCLVRNTQPARKIYDDQQWKWLFGINSDETSQPLDYGMPSAVIKANFDKVAHPKRQPIKGFGGAFTEASALNYMTLNKEGRDAVLELLFGKDGLGYSLGRVPLNSCDFSPVSYNFDDVDGDFSLKNFDVRVEHDAMNGMIEFLLQAQEKLQDSWEDKLNVIASPWSPPAWMKKPTNYDNLTHPGAEHASSMTGSAQPNCLREGVGPESRYAKSWALYFSKFLSAYKNWGIDFFAVTVQNEPEFAAPWEACSYTASIEGEFVANHLGPTLEKDHPDVKILIFDHNKDHAPHWGQTILNENNPASKYVDGTAVHWYAGGMDRLLDGAQGSPNMHRFLSVLKNQHVNDDHLLLGTEACHCPSTGYAGGDLKVAWSRAERYAHTILSDLAAGSNGWVEWNLILDAEGGPNHLGNLCDSPLLAVPYRVGGKRNGTHLPDFEHTNLKFGPIVGDSLSREELESVGIRTEYLDRGVVVQPMYYYMGHISRHVRPGSKAVYAIVDQSDSGSNSRTFRKTKGGHSVAGGGMNNLARNGVELTLWPCEGSTRQEWSLNSDGQLEVSGHDWLGKPSKSCVGNMPDKAFGGLILSPCDKDAAIFSTVTLNETLQTVHMLVQNSSNQTVGENCLLAKALEGNGGALGPRGGAQVTIGNCGNESAVWKFDEKMGEVISNNDFGRGTCLTTGWPFLQVGAFIDEKGVNKTMIVLNEASDPANYVLRDNEGEILLTNSIPAHSIQTVII